MAAALWAGVVGAALAQNSPPPVVVAAPAASVGRLAPDFAGQPASAAVRRTLERALALADTQGLPFAVVDKKNARLYVFDATARLVGLSPVLLGSAVGDMHFPNLNQRDLSQLAAHERTTPAGRYAAEPGRNLQGEAVVWVDYDAAFAIHRLRPAPTRERRPERLASATPDDNRISLGCVVTPVEFYEQVVTPILGRSRSVIYVLPEGDGPLDLSDSL